MMIVEHRNWKIAAHVALIAISAACLLPLILLFMASVSSEASISRNGYSFLPAEFSLSAYSYLVRQAATLSRAYAITIGVTAVGTILSLATTTLMAYPLSRKDLRFHKQLTFFVFFTMLFNGGLVPTYLVYTQLFHIKNTIFALVFPYLFIKGFNVLVMRTFFINTIPPALLEAAKLDGAGEFRTLTAVVLPLSLPILATIGLFSAIAYWNDWFNGLIFLTDNRLFSIQNILNRILSDVQFLAASDLATNAAAGESAIPSMTVRMAIAVVGTIPLAAAYPFFQKYFVKGIAIGAIKG